LLRRLAEKVSQLLSSFHPGSYSYQPFKRKEEEEEEDDEDGDDAPRPRSPLRRRAASARDTIYLDLNRPRPFYRSTWRPFSKAKIKKATEVISLFVRKIMVN